MPLPPRLPPLRPDSRRDNRANRIRYIPLPRATPMPSQPLPPLQPPHLPPLRPPPLPPRDERVSRRSPKDARSANTTFVTGSSNNNRNEFGAAPSTQKQQQEDQQHQQRQPGLQQDQQRPRVLSVEEAYGPNFYGSEELGFCYLHPNEPAFWHIGNEAAQLLVLGPNPNPAADSAPLMADPFEVRMRFSGQLQHLNATVVSAQKAAQYAVKYRDLSEDLHSCILEQLEKTNMNTRANIMYFIEHFLEIASKERHAESYVRMMQRDIIRVVDAVCPEDGSGAANVKVVKTVLQGLNGKGFLLDQTLTELEECLKDRDASQAEAGLSSPANGDNVMSTALPANGNAAGNPTTVVPAGHPSGDARTTNGTGHTTRLDKRQIEQRIEEDRERHKRRRENLWVVPRSQVDERAKLMDDASELDDDDFKFEREERAALMDEVEDAKCVHLRPKRGDSPNGRDYSREQEDRHEESTRSENHDHDRMDQG